MMMMMMTACQVDSRSTRTVVWSSSTFDALTPGGTNVGLALDLLCRPKPPPFLTSPVSSDNRSLNYLYISALYCAVIPSLADRREQLSRKFLKSILESSSCLSSLLPNPRDPSIKTRLRSANKFPRLPRRTRKYHKFISCAIAQYQSA